MNAEQVRSIFEDLVCEVRMQVFDLLEIKCSAEVDPDVDALQRLYNSRARTGESNRCRNSYTPANSSQWVLVLRCACRWSQQFRIQGTFATAKTYGMTNTS